MKKQYIKPFMNVHTLKVETAILAASYRVSATDNDMQKTLELYDESTNYGDINTKWEWGNGNNSGVD